MSDKKHLVALGQYRFVLDKNSYEKLTRSIEYRWEKTDIIGNRPNYQMAGTGEDSITLTGAVYNYAANQSATDSPVTETGTDQIEQIRQQAATLKPMLLIFENGRNFGYWMIQSIQEDQTALIGTNPVKQGYTIKLAYFGNSL